MVNWVTDERGTRAELQAGVTFQPKYYKSGWTPTTFTLQMDLAFWSTGSVVFDAGELIHAVGGSYHVPGQPLPGAPLVSAVYETGSRSSLEGTDLGPRTVTLTAEDANGHHDVEQLAITVMRNVTLTAYYTPYERNPHFIGTAPEYGLYDGTPVLVWNGSANETIYVDATFRNAIAQPLQGGGFEGREGFGRFFRWRDSPTSPCDTGIEPPASKRYLRWNDAEDRFEFSANALNAQNPPQPLGSQSTALNTGSNRSYFNMRYTPTETDGAYTIPGLQQHTAIYIDRHSATYKAQDPPDGRIVDDSGCSGDRAYWLDIYFVPENGTYGVSPSLVQGFSPSRWDDLYSTAPPDPIKAYGGGQ